MASCCWWIETANATRSNWPCAASPRALRWHKRLALGAAVAVAGLLIAMLINQIVGFVPTASTEVEKESPP